MRREEIIFNMDEDSGSIDGERILDKIATITFEELEDIPAQEFDSKADRATHWRNWRLFKNEGVL